MIRMQPQLASSSAHAMYFFFLLFLLLNLCTSTHMPVSTAIPAAWSSALGHLVLCPLTERSHSLLAPLAACIRAGMTQRRERPTRRKPLSSALHSRTETKACSQCSSAQTQWVQPSARSERSRLCHGAKSSRVDFYKLRTARFLFTVV